MYRNPGRPRPAGERTTWQRRKTPVASPTRKEGSGKKEALETALAQIEKQFGKGAVMKLGPNVAMQVDAISTGSLALDLALGVGGVPRGRVVEIYGPESSGKTTLALHVLAEAQKAGGEAAFIDVEHALDPVYAKALGVDIDSLLVSQPDTGEQALEICEALVRSRRHRRHRHRLGGRHGAPGGDRGRDGRQPCGPAGPADEPGPAQAHRRHRQDQHAWPSSSTSCGKRWAWSTATRRSPPAAGR